MAGVKSDHQLHVLMPSIAGQQWSCHSCGDCCRTLVGHLFEHERDRIDRQGWDAELGAAPYVRAGRSYALNKRSDGACVFLDKDNRCLIHSRYGEEAKPLACRVFPFSLRPAPGGWQVSLRFDCPSVVASSGQPVRDYAPLLRRIAGELGAPGAARAIFGKGTAPQPTQLNAGQTATPEEVDALNERLVRWVSRRQPAITARVVIAARWTTALAGARLEKVRGPRFGELMDVLLGGLAAEFSAPPPAPTWRQQGMLRQFSYACCEHVTLDQLQGGIVRKLGLRLGQLRHARAFLRGDGMVPPVAGIPAGIPFAAVEQVRPARDDDGRIAALLQRYLQARAEGHTLFGDGYYGWPVFRGLAALWESIAAVGWLARAHAVAAGRESLGFDDVGTAIGVIDRAATRLPALGSVAERGRITYLLADDGLARLLNHYALV